MRRIIFAILIQAGTCGGCASTPQFIGPGPGHPASTAEPEAPRPGPTATLKPESVPSMLDNSPKSGTESRQQPAPASRPAGGHHGHGGGRRL
jgi:hypothetical protein